MPVPPRYVRILSSAVNRRIAALPPSSHRPVARHRPPTFICVRFILACRSAIYQTSIDFIGLFPTAIITSIFCLLLAADLVVVVVCDAAQFHCWPEESIDGIHGIGDAAGRRQATPPAALRSPSHRLDARLLQLDVS